MEKDECELKNEPCYVEVEDGKPSETKPVVHKDSNGVNREDTKPNMDETEMSVAILKSSKESGIVVKEEIQSNEHVQKNASKDDTYERKENV